MVTFDTIHNAINGKIHSIDIASSIPSWAHQIGGAETLLEAGIDPSWEQINPAYTWSSAQGEAWFRQQINIADTVEGICLQGTKLSFEFIMPIGASFYVNGEKRYSEPSWADSRSIPLVISESLDVGTPLDLAICANKGDGFGLLLHTRLYLHALEELRFRLLLVVAQFQFAQYLAGDCDQQKQLINQAAALLDEQALIDCRWDAWWLSTQKAIDLLMPLNDKAKEHVIHIVAHSHIDMNWLWPYAETVEVCRRDFSSMLSLMERYPEFVFSQSQAATYRDMESNYPEIFQGIKTAIDEGRWDVTASEWVENDLNTSGSEATARQFLYANNYISDKFGVKPKICWCPDTFGHPANIPQILTQVGIEYYYHCRAGNGEPLGRWEGIDGSSVLSTHDVYGYGGDIMPTMMVQCMKHFATKLHTPLAYWVYGVGDHGGAATAVDIEHARVINAAPLMPQTICSSSQKFFDTAKKLSLDLPVHKGEMNTVFEGCYSSHADIKLMNRRSENNLISAETISATSAALLGTRYPIGDLTEAWRITCFHQFHDILCGCSIGVTYDEAAENHALVSKIANRTISDAAGSLALAIDTGEGDEPRLVVYNQLAWSRTDLVCIDDISLSFVPKAMRDSNGNLTAVQHSEGKLYFVAHDVPSMGSQVYTPVADAEVSTSITANAAGLSMENAYLKLAVHPASGALCNLLHKASGRELAGGGGGWGPEANLTSGMLNRLQVQWEQPHPMSAWNIGDITRVDHLITGADVQLEEVGPVFATILISRNMMGSSMSQKLRIYDGLSRVDYITTIDWHEQGTATTDAPMLKATFTPTIGCSVATFETPYAPLVRPADGRESPALRWADVGDGEFGLSLMNNCKYGYSAHGNTLALTLVRASYEPDNHPDEGIHEMIYSIYPYQGSWQEAGSDRRAAELNQPMVASVTTAHEGKLKPGLPALEIDSPAVMVSAFKLAEAQHEHGTDYILRLYEAHGKPVDCQLCTSMPISCVHTSNILEAALEPIPLDDGKISLTLRPYEIATLLLHIS